MENLYKEKPASLPVCLSPVITSDLKFITNNCSCIFAKTLIIHYIEGVKTFDIFICPE